MKDNAQKLADAIERGDIGEVGPLLRGEPRLANAVLAEGSTPLHLATLCNHKEIVELLISNGADVNAKDDNGYAPIFGVAFDHEAGDPCEVVKTLIAHGADVNTRDTDGLTPLHNAAMNGKRGVVELLLANNADPTLKSKLGITAEQFATEAKHHDIANILAQSTARAIQRPLAAVDLNNQGPVPKDNPVGGSFFTSKPFIALVVAAVVLCGGVALLKSLAEKTALSFDFSLDGKALSAGKVPDVRVDGQPFTSGSKIGMGRHEITAQLQDVEPLDQHFWVLFGAKSLGTRALETSKGSLTVAVNPTPASVVVRRAGETVRQGEAPLRVEKLPIGDYMVVVRRGEYEETQSVNVRRQQRAEAKIDLKLGSADLSAEPADAEFELSGGGRHWQGKLPLRVNDVPVGSYSLVARRKGWELTGDISVIRGNVTSNRVEFPYGSIDVTSEPSGLVVSTNGVEVGKTPAALRELRPGSYEVTASDGENDLAATISVGPKENVKKSFVFRYGAVQLASTPPGAAVLRKGKEVGKTPLTLGRVPAGESPVELRFDGCASTNVSIVALEGVTTNYSVKLMSVRYLESMKQAREAFDASQFSESQKLLASALAAEPNDPVAVAFQAEVSKAIAKAEEARKKAEREAQEAAKKQEEALRAEQANAKAQAIASLEWLDFQKVMSDCSDTRQVQYPVVMDVGSYQTYRDSDGKYKQRWVKTGQTTEMHTMTEATFNPEKFSAKYAGRPFRFNCPDKWSVSKVEKDGAVIFKAGGFSLSSDAIRATAPTSSRDALSSLQKGQKVSIKGVLKKYEQGFWGKTLFLEDAELLDK